MDLGLPIGLDDNIADFIDHTSVALGPGDGVVLYTGGIPEAYNPAKKQGSTGTSMLEALYNLKAFLGNLFRPSVLCLHT